MFFATVIMGSFKTYSMSVGNIICGTGVKNRKVVNPSDEFRGAKRIWCLVELKNVKNSTYIVMRWVLNDRHFDIKLPVKPYNRFRTWSYKTIYPSMKGVWKLEIFDKNNKLLKEKVFVVK